MALSYIIYGRAVFTTAARRDAVVRQWERTAAGQPVEPSSALAGYGPGLVAYTWVAPPTGNDPEITPGASYAAFHMQFSVPDKATQDAAQLEVMTEMQKGGWLSGEFGTATVVT